MRRLGLRQLVTAYKTPLQDVYAERLIGTQRRECLDHVIVTATDCGAAEVELMHRNPIGPRDGQRGQAQNGLPEAQPGSSEGLMSPSSSHEERPWNEGASITNREHELLLGDGRIAGNGQADRRASRRAAPPIGVYRDLPDDDGSLPTSAAGLGPWAVTDAEGRFLLALVPRGLSTRLGWRGRAPVHPQPAPRARVG